MSTRRHLGTEPSDFWVLGVKHPNRSYAWNGSVSGNASDRGAARGSDPRFLRKKNRWSVKAFRRGVITRFRLGTRRTISVSQPRPPSNRDATYFGSRPVVYETLRYTTQPLP
ncbi:unnamed protein product [Lota lota]